MSPRWASSPTAITRSMAGRSPWSILESRMMRCSALVLCLGSFVLLGCRPSVEAPPAPAAEFYRDGKVVLGSPRLTAGIPGRGELTIEQIKVLAKP